jgi:hypothetical protein
MEAVASRERAGAMGAAARTHALAKFRLDEVVRRFEALYDELL